MNFLKSFALATALLLPAAAANAVVFAFDEGASSITLTETSDVCAFCTLTADFNPATVGLSWDVAYPGPHVFVVDNFIDWDFDGLIGTQTYDVVIDLAFSAPSAASGGTTGDVFVGTFFGLISGGSLTWTGGPGTINFSEGSSLSYLMHDAVAVGFLDTTTTTGATFTLSPTAVPLPLPAFMLLGAIGGLGAFARRRRSLAA